MDSLKLQSLASRPARIRSACRTGLPSFHSDLAVKGRGQAKASNVNDVINDPVVDKPIACVKPAVAEKRRPFVLTGYMCGKKKAPAISLESLPAIDPEVLQTISRQCGSRRPGASPFPSLRASCAGHFDNFAMRNDGPCFDIGVGFRHHFLKYRVGFDFVEAVFRVRIKLDGFAHNHAAIAITVGCQVLEQFIRSFIKHKLVSHGESLHGPDSTPSVELSTSFMNG